MPRQPERLKALDKKWNMYVNEVEKAEFMLALGKQGHTRSQSAAVRAFMYLYANDELVREKTNAIIDNYIVYNVDGQQSKL